MSKENDQFNEENPIDFVRSIRLKNNEKFKEMLKTKHALTKHLHMLELRYKEKYSEMFVEDYNERGM